MKRTTKGAIAVGAATLLLLGGGGTFALWNDSATLNAGTVESGHLTVDTAFAAGVWKDANNVTFNPLTDLAVPGDVLTYTTTVEIDAEGKNLEFTAFIDPDTLDDALDSGWVFNDDVDIAIADGTGTFAAPVDADGVDYNPTALPASFQLFKPLTAGTGTLTLSFSLTFGDDLGAGTDNANLDNFATLSALAVTIQQVFEK